MSEWAHKTIDRCLQHLSLRALSTLPTTEYKHVGKYPVVDQGKGLIAGRTDDDSGLITIGLPLVVFGDHTRIVKYVDFAFVRGVEGTQVLKTRDDVNPLFFYFSCKFIDLPSRGYNRHFKTLKESKIPIPPLQEQLNIGRALRKLEDAVAVQDEQLGLWNQTKNAAMRALFSQGLRGEAQKKTEIGSVPESWDVVPFGSVRHWLQYGTSVRCTYEVTNFPVLRIPNIEPGHVNARGLKYADFVEAVAENYRLQGDDLIFIRTNGVLDRLGSCAVYSGDPPNALFASYLIRARLNLDHVIPHFAAQFFGSERGTQIVAGRATPAADGKYNLNTGTIDSLPLPLPSTLDEQREIVAVLDAIDRKIDLHRRKRALLDDLFKTLLHKLMTGEIRVADLDLSALEQTATTQAAA